MSQNLFQMKKTAKYWIFIDNKISKTNVWQWLVSGKAVSSSSVKEESAERSSVESTARKCLPKVCYVEYPSCLCRRMKLK